MTTQADLLAKINSPQDIKNLSIEELEQLASEVRTTIYDQVSKTGGHLAPNLGVVELTIALHYVFDFKSDRLLFDVGHQCYPHKLLTGRKDAFTHLRTREGMSGFPEPKESVYDLFAVGHAGTAISTAVGMARGDQINNESFHPEKNTEGRRVVALVGDAAIVNGIAMEGLNNAGTLKRQFLVVLNDNGMAIAKPQGAVAAYFDRVRTSRTYQIAKRQAKQVVSRLPGKSIIEDAYHRLGEVAKASLNEDAMFEEFGLITVGPIDGHDLRSLISVLIEVRDFDRPMVLHVHTTKGKGYEHCEQDATTFHSPKPFTLNGCSVELKSSGRSFTAAYADAMEDLMDRDDKIVACSAAMPTGTGISKVLKKYPDRVWDTGICESHATDMMAGLAKTGLKPFFAVYSTFLQRAFDQVFQECALQGLPIRLCLDRAGLVGGDGAVHHGFCDISILRVFPQAALMAAIDEPSLRAALEFMSNYDSGISALRYPRDVVDDRFANQTCPPFILGKARPLIEEQNPDLAILAYGVTAMNALDARQILGGATGDYRINIYDARFAKPVDIDLIQNLIKQNIPILTLEDHALTGGFGSAVIESCNEHDLPTHNIHRIGIPEEWIIQDSRPNQLKHVGLDCESIARTIRDILDSSTHEQSRPDEDYQPQIKVRYQRKSTSPKPTK